MICQYWTKGGERSERDERGSVLVEFSFVFALFVLVIYALITFGLILATKNSITHAAAEGARAAISVPALPAATLAARQQAKAADTVAQSLSWFGSKYQPGDTVATVGPCPSAPASSCITVKITYPYQSRPIVPPAPGLGLVTPNTLTSTAVVELS